MSTSPTPQMGMVDFAFFYKINSCIKCQLLNTQSWTLRSTALY